MIKAEILPKNGFVAVKHIAKYARVKSMSAVMLGNVKIDGPKAIGNLTGEFETDMSWDDMEIPDAIKSKFRTARYEDGQFEDAKTRLPLAQAKALVAFGDSFYYLP